MNRFLRLIATLLSAVWLSIGLAGQTLLIEPDQCVIGEDGTVWYSSSLRMQLATDSEHKYHWLGSYLIMNDIGSKKEWYLVQYVCKDDSIEIETVTPDCMFLYNLISCYPYTVSKWERKDDSDFLIISFSFNKESLDLLEHERDVNLSISGYNKDWTYVSKNLRIKGLPIYTAKKDINKLVKEHPLDPTTVKLPVIRETPDTKVFPVSSLSQLRLGDYRDGYGVAIESNTHQAHIFNRYGTNTGNYKSSSYSYGIVGGEVFVDFLANSDGMRISACIDTTGAVVYSSDKDLSNFVDGVAMNNGRYINAKGEIVFPFKNTDIQIDRSAKVFPLSDNRRKVHLHDASNQQSYYSYGYLDENNSLVIPATFEDASNYSEGLAAVCRHEGSQPYWGYIDKEGHVVIDYKYTNVPGDFHDGFAKVTKKNRKVVFINKEGQVVSPEYDEATDFYNGYAFVVVTNNGIRLRQVIDTDFVVKRTDQTRMPEWISRKHNTYCEYNRIIQENQIRRLDSGTLVLGCKGYDIGTFDDDLTWFETKGKKGYINTQGEIILFFSESEF